MQKKVILAPIFWAVSTTGLIFCQQSSKVKYSILLLLDPLQMTSPLLGSSEVEPPPEDGFLVGTGVGSLVGAGVGSGVGVGVGSMVGIGVAVGSGVGDKVTSGVTVGIAVVIGVGEAVICGVGLGASPLQAELKVATKAKAATLSPIGLGRM